MKNESKLKSIPHKNGKTHKITKHIKRKAKQQKQSNYKQTNKTQHKRQSQ